jgi:hypothetical protein
MYGVGRADSGWAGARPSALASATEIEVREGGPSDGRIPGKRVEI